MTPEGRADAWNRENRVGRAVRIISTNYKGTTYTNANVVTGSAVVAVWCRGRSGQVVACEGPGADWLPFRPLGDFKTSRGRSDERIWTND